MAKGYWLFQVTINDPDTYQKYVERMDVDAFAKHGARFLVRGGQFQAVEGATQQRHVIIEFESYEKALACYRSPEYQAASELRRAAALTDLVIVEGVAT